jgi:hypothetical protein
VFRGWKPLIFVDQESSMKKTISICLLTMLFSVCPAIGQDFEKCAQMIMDSNAQALKEVEALGRQEAELSRSCQNPTTKEEQDSCAEAHAAIKRQYDAIGKRGEEVAKQANRCMGIPVTDEEAKQQEADAKARYAKMEQDWKAAVKPYENMPADPSGYSKASGAGSDDSQGSGIMTQGLISMPPVPEQASAPPTAAPTTMSPFGSGRTPQQRSAALVAVNLELDRMPYSLPKKEDAPSKNDMLAMASARNASARNNFRPDELSNYSRVVTWVPRFDGVSPDAEKARELSLIVSSATNYFNRPQLVIALATAVFSLDPQSTAAANNLASAIVTAGERQYPKTTQAKDLAPYRKDAESCFLYALANSMKEDAWTDESLTALINLGYLYIDMNRLEEARSLFQVARKQSPFSWDAAKGMAAYFHAVKQPAKAVAILEDDNLDKPESIMVAKKHAKALEKKNDDVPLDSPEEVYEDRLEAVNSEPIATAADFISQIDQSTRNKMRYFVENLPAKGSFTAPSINKLTQYASLRAIWGPQGLSAMKDFQERLQIYSVKSFASNGDEQLKMLSRLGINLDLGIDLNDVAKNPKKYVNRKNRPKVKVDTSGLKSKLDAMRKQAETAKRDLATQKTDSSMALAAMADPFFAIAKLDPQEYADPMNIIIQKHNFAVLNRKFNLYNGYLYSVNRKSRQQFTEVAENYQRKVAAAEKIQEEELKRIPNDGSAEAALQRHNAHIRYFNACNAAAEQAFGSATSITTIAYVQKIRPKSEAFYYDVIRHVALISDPDVRNQKDAELHRAIYSALVNALQLVGAAHGSFKYHPEWECGCNYEGLLAKREAEEEARKEEENARIERNKAAKAAFDSGEIPESSPLFKKLDGMGSKVDLGFISWNVSCARTVVNFKLDVPLVPGSPKVWASQEISEFTGAGKYDQGLKVSVKAGEGVKAYFGMSSSVSMNGEGVVKDYSVTAATGVSVSSRDTSVNIGGEMTFGPGGEVRDSDFSAGISRDFSNEVGTEGSASFEASTKRGCSMSGKVEHTLESAQDFIDQAKTKAVGKDAADLIPTDFFKKEIWSGNYETDKRDSAGASNE